MHGYSQNSPSQSDQPHLIRGLFVSPLQTLQQIFRQNLYLWIALFVAIVAAWPLISGGGLLNTRGGGDSPFLLERLHQLEQALRDGHFPVRWMPDANYGYGYPFFNFYAPLAFYVAVLFRFLNFSIIESIQLSQLIAFLVAAYGSFRLAARWFIAQPIALLASIAYTVAPFHLVNVYVRGDSIAEFWAMALYPIVILTLDTLFSASDGHQGGHKTLSLRQPFYSLGFSFAYAALIVSHNISAMIFSPFVLLYAAICLIAYKQERALGLLRFVLAFGLGLMLSAWFWLPAIGEQSLTQLSEITAGYFDYNYQDGYHFRSDDLVQGSYFYDPDVSGGEAFRMGLLQALFVGAGSLSAAAILWRERRRRDKRFWGAVYGLSGLLIATLMLSPYSLFLWDQLPLLPYTQFPWRFLSVQAFFGALLTGLLLSHADRHKPLELGLLALSGLLLITAGLGNINPSYLPLADEDITARRIVEYEWFTRNIGTTISAEYLAKGMTPRPVTSAWLESGQRQMVLVTDGDAQAALIEKETGWESWQIQVLSPEATLVLPTMYWDGWRATVRGEPISLSATPNSGLMQVTLPSGEHQLELELGRSPVRRWGERLALIGLLVAGMLLVIGRQPIPLWEPLWIAGLSIVVILAARPFAPPLPDDQLLTWDFGEMGYLHRAESIFYGHGAELTGYRYASDAIETCSSFLIELDWENPPSGETRNVTLALTTPAENFFSDVQPALIGTQPLLAGTAKYRFDVPPDTPLGLVVPALSLSDRNRPRALNGDKRGYLFLKPIPIVDGCQAPSNEPLVGPFDIGQLVSIIHLPAPDNALQLEIPWLTSDELGENLAVSLRLTDLAGREIHAAQRDTQPGFGYRPTSLWPSNRPVYDYLNLQLPEEMPFPPPYVVLTRLYDPASGQVLLSRRLGQLEGDPAQLTFVPHTPRNDWPLEPEEDKPLIDVSISLGAENTDIIELAGYSLKRSDQELDLTLYWRAVQGPPADYSHFVHLLDPITGVPLAQRDGQPDNNTYPTGQWIPGEVVADRVILPLADIPAGRYPLTVGLYENRGDSFPRLVRSDGAGDAIEIETIVIE